MRIDVQDLRKSVAGGTVVLDGVSFAVQPGELVGIVGGSGAGKTTLLEAMAGLRTADAGHVRFDGIEVAAKEVRGALGYVPQDDIIHLELPVEHTLRYAARLRLPPSTTGPDIDAAVARALESLDLTKRAHVRVGALSGGQRKRVSIAVELLTDPRLFFLDEPTSGLDPVTSAQLVARLRELGQGGRTVVFTTHAMQDLRMCDRVLFMAPGGRLAYTGSLMAALAHYGVDSPEEIYGRLETDGAAPAAAPPAPPPDAGDRPFVPAKRPGPFRQWRVLTARTFETITRNRLTLAILLGSPALVVAMFVVLFKPGAFDFANPTPSAIVMIIFWITFGAFFFGLTYGLLQIVTELPVLRRERFVGLSLGAYLMSKVAVLMPFLLVVDVMMIGILRALDRLPSASLGTYVSVGVTLALVAAAALALGLLTSAAVSTASQATLALPMLCFPAVLFSGAILPVHVMAGVGKVISALMVDRWGFESIGHTLELRHLFEAGGSDLGPPLLAAYGDAGKLATGTYWVILAAFTLVFLAAAWATLARRSGHAER